MSVWEKRRLATPIFVIVLLAGVSLFYIFIESKIDATYMVTIDERNHTKIRRESTDQLHVIETEQQLQLLEAHNVTSSPISTSDSVPTNVVLLHPTSSIDTVPVTSPTDTSPPEVVESGDNQSEESSQEVITNDVESNNLSNVTVITFDGLSEMNNVVSRYWKGNLFCETIDQTRSVAEDPNLPLYVNVSFSCKELFEKSELGTGNFIALLYGFRMAAHVYGNIELSITCYDAEDTKNDLILPWIMGTFPARPISEPSSINTTLELACGSYATQPLAYMYHEIQHDLRRMAIGLMGIPNADHPSAAFAKEYLYGEPSIHTTSPTRGRLMLPNPRLGDQPPFPSSQYELDDSILHFRCGDLMSSNHPSFAFMKFSGYTRHISDDAKTIGIITQPFDDDTQSRAADSGKMKRDRCRTVVYSLVEYVKEHYPNAQVRVHNAVGETIALTFARMIMSNQAIAGISSFGVIPAIATFGTGYIRQPDYRKAPNQWLLQPRIDELTPNVVLFYEPNRIMVGQMKGLWSGRGEQGVLDWFWNDTIQVRTFI